MLMFSIDVQIWRFSCVALQVSGLSHKFANFKFLEQIFHAKLELLVIWQKEGGGGILRGSSHLFYTLESTLFSLFT
jgi:hypothetical protein